MDKTTVIGIALIILQILSCLCSWAVYLYMKTLEIKVDGHAQAFSDYLDFQIKLGESPNTEEGNKILKKYVNDYVRNKK